MEIVIHKANSRGHVNHGWLEAYHSFSFGNYHNPQKTHFGVLRVLNDDYIAGGKGFGTHPHDNMEIITIPLEGALEHRDDMGNTKVIESGNVQVMSAGTGVYHSEYNANQDKPVKLLQIWLFPNQKEVLPRYDQISTRELETKNQLYQVLSPNPEDGGVWIHQDAWFSLGRFDKEVEEIYKLKTNENGVYVLLIEGEANIEGNKLSKRDAIGIWDTDTLNIKASKGAYILLMEVPMRFI